MPILGRAGRAGRADLTLCFVLPVDSDDRQRERCLSLLIAQARRLGQAGDDRRIA